MAQTSILSDGGRKTYQNVSRETFVSDYGQISYKTEDNDLSHHGAIGKSGGFSAEYLKWLGS